MSCACMLVKAEATAHTSSSAGMTRGGAQVSRGDAGGLGGDAAHRATERGADDDAGARSPAG